ncbi:MAG: hypothetical protein KZQ83_17800 [gamma proteobacterium symbiont of Taylorina sp.]|nr:hypothetical protein [gamma proteobacterium symbiont of Taylorina sp.]
MNKLDAGIKHMLLLITDKERKAKSMQDDIDAWKHRLSQKVVLKNRQQGVQS